MWHFLKPVVRGFLRVLRFPPLLLRLMVSAKKVTLKINAISAPPNLIAELSLRTKKHTTVAHDLHTIVPWPLERTCWRQFTA